MSSSRISRGHWPGQVLAIAGLAPLAVGLIAACTSSASSPGAQSRTNSLEVDTPSIAVTPTATTVHGLALPIQSYLPTAADQNVVINAEQNLTARCMSRFGFTWTYAPSDVQDYDQITRAYGIGDPATAAEYGYHLPASDPSAQKPKTGPRGPAYSPSELLVLTGSTTGEPAGSGGPTSYKGESIPRGGCQGQSRTKITGVDEIDPTQLAAAIQVAMWKKSQTDPRVVAVFKGWAACMSTAGYTYTDPLEAAADPRWTTPAATRAEVQTARADVSCKQKTNLIGVWYGVESGYEKAAIQQQIQQLTDIKRRWAAAAKKAADLLGVAPPK